VIRDDWTGTVDRVNTHLLRLLLQEGYLPVLTPPGASTEGEAINVDGDRAAATLAAAFRADELVILSNVPGLLREFPDESTLIAKIAGSEVESYLDFAKDRMKKKVLGAIEALRGGVGKVIFADGRVKEPIRKALDGGGTHIL